MGCLRLNILEQDYKNHEQKMFVVKNSLTLNKTENKVRRVYLYGYQGSEKDDEVSGSGNSYTTEFRQLDPRLGRWFSVDPVFQPWQSPYTSMDNNPINLNDVLGLRPGKEKFKNGDEITLKNDEKYTLVEVTDEEEKKSIEGTHYESQTKGGKEIRIHDDKNDKKIKYIDSEGKFYRLESVTPSEQKEKQEDVEKETPKIETPSGEEGPKTGGEIAKEKPPKNVKPTGKPKGSGSSDKPKPKNGENPVVNNPTPVFVPRKSSLDILNIAFDRDDNTFDSPTTTSIGSDPLDEDLKGVISTLRKNRSNFVTIQVTTQNPSFSSPSVFGNTKGLLEARKRAVMNEFQRLAPDVVKSGQVKVFYDNSSLSNSIGFKGTLTEFVEQKKK